MWNALKKFFSKLFIRLNDRYKEVDPYSVEGLALADMRDNVVKPIRDIFFEGAKKIAEHNKAKAKAYSETNVETSTLSTESIKGNYSLEEKAISKGKIAIDMKQSARGTYSHESLTSKPDMKITTLDGVVPNNRADVVFQAKKNAASIGKTNKDGSVSVYIDDINTDVLLGTDGLKHGLRRTKNLQDDVSAMVTLKAGEILKNSICINELIPSKADATSSYVLIGAAKNDSGDLYIVRSIVNHYNNELTSIDVLYAVNAKKESAALNAPRFTAKPLSVTDSLISIAQLLDFVNSHFPDILPESVLRHYGYDTRPKGKIGESALYSSRDTAYLSAVKRGDMETAQRMVDEVANKSLSESKIRLPDGKLRTVYHGTNTGNFTVFNPDYIGMSSGDDGFFGMGFYFAYSPGEAKYYGAKRVISAYLNLKNPFDFEEELQKYKGEKASGGYAPDAVALMNFADKFENISKNITIGVVEKDSDTVKEISLAEFSRAFKAVIDNKKFEYSEITNEYGEKETLVTADPKTYKYEYDGQIHSYVDYLFQKRFWGKPNKLDVAYEYLANSVYRYVDMIRRTRLILDNNKEFTESLKAKGYDGVIQSKLGDEAVAFYPEQIKSADPVTYDDDGNVIPLSERFTPENKDIRYSSRTRYSAGQMAAMKANLSHSKVYTKSSAMQLVNELAPKIRNRSFEVLADELWRGLNTFTSLDDKRTFASDMAEMFIDRMMVDTLVKNDEWDEAVEKMAYIKHGMSYLADMHPTEAMKIHCTSYKF